ADVVADTMHAGRVVIHGDGRDVLGQALQGGEVFVRGSVGNRGGIQMREYRESKPYLIVGGRADDYFGEYMAGGVAMILGLGSLEKGLDTQLVGDFTATGIVGGRIYVRGRVKETSIGLLPPRVDVVNYLNGLVDDGPPDVETFGNILAKPLTPSVLKETLPPAAFNRIRRLFEGKYNRYPRVEFRHLSDEDLRLVGGELERFFREFHLDGSLYEALLGSEFTVITPARQFEGVGEAYAEE
ncbi:MAG: glutamate synthase, partial [Candidatus Bathyarchaeia archaeon]